MFSAQFTDTDYASTLAHAIVDTVREPFVVLDEDLRVVAASRSFYRTFTVSPGCTQGKLLYELGNGEWNTPDLRTLLGKILPEHGAMENFEVEHDFPDIGRRTMLLNARKVLYEQGSRANILLGIEDITGQRFVEREKDGTAPPEGRVAWRNSTSDRQQSADHRQYHHVEGQDGAVGRNPAAFERGP